ncbi:MAG: GspH/FimT family protein [Deltaproteobacteria bacterium]|nr:GspH/FimT family protein [Deltaproteobacteria bacterium]
MKKQNGFTIYELLTVIGIIGILAIIAVPNMISWRSEVKLRGASNNLRGDLQLAKLSALREKDIVAVIFTANSYHIFFDSGAGGNAGNWNLDADEVLIRNRQLPAGVSIALPTTLDAPNNRTRFDGRGLPDPATLSGGGLTGTVTLQNSSGSQMPLTINRLGRINDT